MAEGKKSFVLYCDLIHEVDHLTNEEKGILFQHLLEYVNDMNPVLEDRVILGSWKHIERQLKRDLQKYKQIREKRRQAGAKGGKQSQANASFAKQTKANQAVTVNDTVNDTVTVTVSTDVDNARIKPKDRIPTLENFIDYGLEQASRHKLNVTRTSLEMKYEAWKLNGWVNGNGQQIKNWKSSLINTLKYIQEVDKGKPKEYESPEDRDARIFMEELKRQAVNESLYGGTTQDNNQQNKQIGDV